EWEFKKEMYTWVTKAETRISNFGTVAVQFGISDMRDLVTHLKSEAHTVLSTWEKKLLDDLTQYFKQTEGHVYLVERYRQDFANSAKILRREMESSVVNQLTAAADIRQGMTELDRIKENHTKELEGRICALIEECRKKKVKMTEEELNEEFNKMWTQTEEKLSFSKIQVHDIYMKVSYNLRTNLTQRGINASESLCKKNLQDSGAVTFKYSPQSYFGKYIHKFNKALNIQDHTMKVQEMADSIIQACTQFVKEKTQRKTNYHDTYIQEILKIIDERILNNHDVKTDSEFEVSLKLHICGIAAEQFQKMHEDFIHENDPYRCLNRNKDKFRADFKDVFHERDQCQKKAEEFTERCLKPAVEDFVNRSLGPDIIGEMMTSQQFSTRMFFQYSVLVDLLSKGKFENYLSNIRSYEDYVKNWILEQIVERFSKGSTMSELEDKHVQSCVKSIYNAINKAKTKQSGSLKTFVEDVCKELGDKLVISQDAFGAFMILNNADQKQFAHWLTKCIKDMAEALKKKFNKTDFKTKLYKLHVKPQNELFTKLIGCGKQCPFCKAPCEAGGQAHTQHWTSLHRPEGLGRYRWDETKKLVTDICTSSVNSDNRFRCDATKGKWHPYKRYTEIFPDWDIGSDKSLKASHYWKYVMRKFNTDFAEAYNAKPADIPETWINISDKQAEESLKESFNIKRVQE
ncbi:interferon-induced very large GTPase 1-like, partial [Plectropomus leopardus]|uniref:interferon-induced very large GTPase 1-like n=1 Tax=Plectropomus leopardus TaxID=160734 RepID=UPI001C4BABC0